MKFSDNGHIFSKNGTSRKSNTTPWTNDMMENTMTKLTWKRLAIPKITDTGMVRYDRYLAYMA